MTKYRKTKGTDVWHWCQNCSNWPTSNYDVSYAKPTEGKLDEECRRLEESGGCRK